MGNLNSKTFCAGPYTEVRINSNGSLNFCHAALGNNIPVVDNIKFSSLDEYFYRSKTVIQIKNQIESGHYVDQCHRCYRADDLGLVSFRQRRNIQYGIFPGLDFDQSVDESIIQQYFHTQTQKPKFYHVSFSNLCNMACMMCNPRDSSLLTATLGKATIIPLQQEILQDWTQGPAWTQFCEHLLNNDEIVCLHVMGGEPLYHKRFRELLTLLQDKKHTNFHLTFVTNGSIYDSSIISLLANFKSVVIEISIDGIGNVNNYIRHTSNSEQIVNNIKSWCKHITKNFDIVLRSVPQVLSAINYDQLLEFADNNNLIIDSNDLINPNFMHLNILPNNLKQQVKDKISNKVLHTDCADTVRDINVRDNSDVLHSLQKNAKLVIAQLDSKCQDIENKRLEFVDYCVKFDRYRGFNIRDYIPELLDFMNEYGYEQKLYSN